MKFNVIPLIVVIVEIAKSDFIFQHFHDTTGLKFVGDAFTSSCANASKFAYGDVHSPNVERFDEVELPSEFTESTTIVEKTEVRTNPHGYTNDEYAQFGHRDDFEKEPLSECPVRVRLTPSKPSRVGALWYTQGIEVLSGFECGFRFQITDLSRSCNYVKDRNFGLNMHKACAVHGGDGFAFVIHGDQDELETLGNGAQQMGYGGIENALAIEFDTWYNPDMGDLFSDHVSIHSAGPLKENDAGESTQLGLAKLYSLADGKEHLVRVRYYPEIVTEFIPYFTATQSLLDYIKDNEEGKRVGTLAVFMDGETTTPFLAMPINLSVLLSLSEGTAIMGFTASTGRSWEKHDIISWYCCEEPPCLHASTIHGMDHHNHQSQPIDYHDVSVEYPELVRDVPDHSTPADPSHVSR